MIDVVANGVVVEIFVVDEVIDVVVVDNAVDDVATGVVVNIVVDKVVNGIVVEIVDGVNAVDLSIFFYKFFK